MKALIYCSLRAGFCFGHIVHSCQFAAVSVLRISDKVSSLAV
jgi:hypothetical protein